MMDHLVLTLIIITNLGLMASVRILALAIKVLDRRIRENHLYSRILANHAHLGLPEHPQEPFCECEACWNCRCFIHDAAKWEGWHMTDSASSVEGDHDR